MLVKAKWNVKDGNGWHKAGEVFETKEDLGDAAEIVSECVKPETEPAEETVVEIPETESTEETVVETSEPEPEPEPKKETITRAGSRRKTAAK